MWRNPAGNNIKRFIGKRELLCVTLNKFHILMTVFFNKTLSSCQHFCSKVNRCHFINQRCKRIGCMPTACGNIKQYFLPNA